jgi:hypothetical protein
MTQTHNVEIFVTRPDGAGEVSLSREIQIDRPQRFFR